MIRKLVLILLTTAPMISVTVAQETFSASGSVVSVRLTTRTVTVRDPRAGEVIRYSVPLGTPITIAGGEARLGHLRSGDRVDVTYRRTDEGRQATRLAVPNADPGLDRRVQEGLFSTVTGRVSDINYAQRTITVIGDQSGERYSYAIPEGTRITIGGESARLGNLRRRDQVVLRFSAEADQRQAARIRVPQTTTPLAQRPVQTTPAQRLPRELPRTASPLPLLAAFGLGAMVLAGGLGAARRRRRS